MWSSLVSLESSTSSLGLFLSGIIKRNLHPPHSKCFVVTSPVSCDVLTYCICLTKLLSFGSCLVYILLPQSPLSSLLSYLTLISNYSNFKMMTSSYWLPAGVNDGAKAVDWHHLGDNVSCTESLCWNIPIKIFFWRVSSLGARERQKNLEWIRWKRLIYSVCSLQINTEHDTCISITHKSCDLFV